MESRYCRRGDRGGEGTQMEFLCCRASLLGTRRGELCWSACSSPLSLCRTGTGVYCMDVNWRWFICGAGTEQHSSVGVHSHALGPRTCSDYSPRRQALHEGNLARLLHPVIFMRNPCQLQCISEKTAGNCCSNITLSRTHVDFLWNFAVRIAAFHLPSTLQRVL